MLALDGAVEMLVASVVCRVLWVIWPSMQSYLFVLMEIHCVGSVLASLSGMPVSFSPLNFEPEVLDLLR